jgi:DHA3 family macrolide efflux protein-like MFS transporter
MTSEPQVIKSGSIFSLPGFRAVWMAQFISIFGDFLALFGIISFIAFRLHGTAVQVTTVTIAYILPLAVIGPAAGVLVDHFNVKRTMIASDVIRGCLALLLLVCSSVPQIASVLLALSVVSCLFIPAQSITVRTIVPRDDLMRANAALSQAFYLIRIASPLVAGALVAWLSEKATFYLDAASFFFSALMLSTLVIDRPPRENADKTLSGLARDFVEGNRFIFTHPGLSFVFLAMAVAMFVLSSFSPLISIFVRDELHAGPFLFGLVSAMVGVGLIASTTVIMRRGGGKVVPGVVLYGLVALGMGTAVLGFSHYAWLAAVSTFLMGVAVALVLIPAQTMSQQETPPEMVGRVSSTFMSMISVAQILGLLLSGGLAERLGMRHLFFSCSVVLVLLAGGGWVWLHQKRNSPLS